MGEREGTLGQLVCQPADNSVAWVGRRVLLCVLGDVQNGFSLTTPMFTGLLLSTTL
jgi:hypothetical protein